MMTMIPCRGKEMSRGLGASESETYEDEAVGGAEGHVAALRIASKRVVLCSYCEQVIDLAGGAEI